MKHLFGMKKPVLGRAAKGVAGVFVVGVVMIGAIAGIAHLQSVRTARTAAVDESCDDPDCRENTYVSRFINFHNHEDGWGFVYNTRTGERYVNHIAWIAKPLGHDSLVCYSDGRKRGYFNKYTGRVVIAPKYDHAWIFSDGVASVEENGYIKFIDAAGRVVIDNKLRYDPSMEGYVFHGGYCVVECDGGGRWGLMDKTGQMVLPREYSYIYPTNNFELWVLQKGDTTTVLDKHLDVVLPPAECSVFIGEGTIDVNMADHTMRKYTMQGELINDFYISSVRMLEYELDEIRYDRAEADDDEYVDSELSAFHPKATARLRAYTAACGFEGLMTADGHVVTMPMYQDIDAIGPDLYLCTSTNYDKVIVNGKGELVR